MEKINANLYGEKSIFGCKGTPYTRINLMETLKAVNIDFFSRMGREYMVYASKEQKDAIFPKYTIFMQTWSDTATGLAEEGDFVGQAFTDAYTVVLEWDEKFYVYFAGQPAYVVEAPINDAFFEDLTNQKLLPKVEALKRY